FKGYGGAGLHRRVFLVSWFSGVLVRTASYPVQQDGSWAVLFRNVRMIGGLPVGRFDRAAARCSSGIRSGCRSLFSFNSLAY
ncbi:MAG: hypothetical protein KDI09_19390, partial [Halioglobus sp.]|nr:hypothetical protein [Halioglobus sp.]